MASSFQIIKYTGKNSIFGTPVTSIGLKRVDQAVPAVYGNPIVPGDDKSDILHYSVITPEDNSKAYSFESVFKLHLKTTPTNQLSNIRIYPETHDCDVANGTAQSATATTIKINADSSFKDDFYTGLKIQITNGTGIGQTKIVVGYVGLTKVIAVDSAWGTIPDGTSTYQIYKYVDTVHSPKLFIGSSQYYTRPTNIKSLVALKNIFDFNKKQPYPVTVGGLYGYQISPETFQVYLYQITVGDTGSGNRFYLNGDKQPVLKIIEGNTYTFVNNVTGTYDFRIYDTTNTLVVNADVVYSVDGNSNQVITINASSVLLASFSAGFIYGSLADYTIGSTIVWFDISLVPTETVNYTVEVAASPNNEFAFYLNGARNPTLLFELGKKYQFTNLNGDTDPFRIFTKGFGGTQEFVIVEGVTVTNGGTINEVVLVDTTLVNIAGKLPGTYQSTNNVGYGNAIDVDVPNTDLGRYNLNTIGGGINPTGAGETDFIYLQAEVDKDTDPYSYIPNIIIEYDES